MGNSPLGGDVRRVDGRVKVAGMAKYGSDNNFDGLLHGYVLVSTTARATIQRIDDRAARRSPGVVAVFTPFHPLKLVTPTKRKPWVPMQNKEVEHQGQPIGLVVAKTIEQARDAAATVRVDYIARTPQASLSDGIAGAQFPDDIDGEPPVLATLADGVASIAQAVADSEYRITATYTTAPQAHVPMEPHSAVAVWNDGGLVIYSGNQGMSTLVEDVAEALQLEVSQVRGINPFVGGSFGGKFSTYAPAFLAAAAARALRRPVKVVLTREQAFTCTVTRPGTVQNITLGARRDGTLTAISHDAWATASTLKTFADQSAHRASRNWYRSENIGVSQRVVPLNVPMTGIMRAPGEATGAFALETAMDELAEQLDMDPLALRRKNYATVHPGTGLPYSSKHLDECYQLGADRIGWDRRSAKPRTTMRGDWYVGVGVATAAFPAWRFPASMKVRFRPDGAAEVSGSTSDAGTGMWTVLAILGSDTLGIPIERIRPNLGDSTLAPAGFVGGSSGTSSIGPAVMAAAAQAKRALLRLAVTDTRSPFHGRRLDDVRYEQGNVRASGLTMDFGTLLRAVGSSGVEAIGSAQSGAEVRDYAFVSFGAQFCEVRVNRLTAEIRVSRMVGVMDAGRVVNQKAARSQIMGGMIWGMSAALHEGLQFEKSGRLANGNVADYLLPVNADVPEVDVIFVEYPDTTHNPLGARGVGELGIVGMAAAVGNAVYNATGVRLRDLPITLDRVLPWLAMK